MSGATPSILDEACSLAEQGVAVHWLRPRSKAPVADQWASAPVATTPELRSSWRDGLNLGIRLGEFFKVGAGFLFAIDLDIRDPTAADEAMAQLRKMVPAWTCYPSSFQAGAAARAISTATPTGRSVRASWHTAQRS
jgi:hypothetical protein